LKKDKDALIFGILYLLVFTLIYASIYYSSEDTIFIFTVLLVYNHPSLFSVLILLFIERMKKKTISQYLYLAVSIVFFYLSFLFWNSGSRVDSKNIYPIFNQGIYIIILHSILSHFIAFFLYNRITKLKYYQDA